MSVVYKRSITNENETETENITLITKPTEEKAITINHTQIFLRPDIVPVVIELIKHYKWPTVYYIYNYEAGKFV